MYNNYFSSVFPIEQLNNDPQLDQNDNTLDTFNCSTEELQEKLQLLNIDKSTGPCRYASPTYSLCIRQQIDPHI